MNDPSQISIHSPHTRGDPFLRSEWQCSRYFNPLPSHEGRQNQLRAEQLGHAISIHSPHTRGDAPAAAAVGAVQISIHSPHARGDGD